MVSVLAACGCCDKLHEFGGLQQQGCILSWAGPRFPICFAGPKSKCGRAPPEAVGENLFFASASSCSGFCSFAWGPCHCNPHLSWVCGVKAPSTILVRSLVIAFRAHPDNLCHLKIHTLNHLSKDPFPYRLILTGSRLGPDIFEDYFSAHGSLLWSSY